MTYKDEPTSLTNKGRENPPEVEEATAEETTALLVGYGSVDHKPNDHTPFDASEDFPLEGEDTKGRKKGLGRWTLVGAGTILYACGVAAWYANRANDSVTAGQQQVAPDVELLGKVKSEKEKKPAFEPIAYPDCPSGVEITYIKQPLPFELHEMAAEASNCHIASIHNLEEISKYSKAGLFKMAFGPEIGMSFSSGKPLTKTFWLGGQYGPGMDAWEWTDGSDWDYGPNATTVEGCLASTFSFIEIASPIVTPEDHWSVVDCSTPLPAVYKCCIPTPSPTLAPTETSTEEPTEEEPAEEPAEEEPAEEEPAEEEPAEEEPAEEEPAEEEPAEEEPAEEEPAEEEPAEEESTPEEETKEKKKTHKKKMTEPAEEEPAEEEPAEEEQAEGGADDSATEPPAADAGADSAVDPVI